MRLEAICLMPGHANVANKIWQNANTAIITAANTAINSFVQIARYRIIFKIMNNRFTSIFGKTS